MRIFFFFQAEDGIRDYKVTGVQTCALPISLELGDPRCLGHRYWQSICSRGANSFSVPTGRGEVALTTLISNFAAICCVITAGWAERRRAASYPVCQPSATH